MQPSERPNLISHGLVSAGLLYASYWLAPYQHDPDSLVLVWMVWIVTAQMLLTFIINLFKF